MPNNGKPKEKIQAASILHSYLLFCPADADDKTGYRVVLYAVLPGFTTRSHRSMEVKHEEKMFSSTGLYRYYWR